MERFREGEMSGEEREMHSVGEREMSGGEGDVSCGGS